jgi:hypothetical protein
MKIPESTALFGAGLVLTIAAGCTPGEQSQPNHPAAPSATSTLPPLEFQRAHEGNFAYAYCGDTSSTRTVHAATYIDSYPDKAAERLITVAAAEGDASKLALVAGATIRKLGQGAYQIATSEHTPPGASSVVDLDVEPYARILKASVDVVFSARKGSDGKAYFEVNCLPNVGFRGDQAVPLNELPTVPPATPNPTPPLVLPPSHQV